MDLRPLGVAAFAALLLLASPLYAQEETTEEEISGENPPVEEQSAPQEASPAPALEKIEVEDPEKSKKITKYCNCKYTADTPYTDRRYRWGGYFGVQSGLYSPEEYQPDFRPTTNFDEYYGESKTPIIEAVMGLKLNFFLGSLSANLSGGYFSAQNERDKSTLSLIPVTGGLLFALDNIFNEPYVVPYGIFGAYTVFYTEKVAGLSVNGNTAPGLFYGGGLMFQLNWMDQDSAYQGYDDYGLENTFLYVEARSFLASASETDPDLSTPIQFGGGLKVEF